MRSRLAMLASCAIAACLPASALAAQPIAEFRLDSSNGYGMYFEFSGRSASVDAIDIPSPLALVSVTYLAKGSFDAGGEVDFGGDRIHVRFGSRGRVVVEFRPSAKPRYHLPPRRCEGEPRITQPGVFIGTINFEGEGGYTILDRSRARGLVHLHSRWKCPRRKGAKRAGLDPEAERFTVLTAESDDGRTSFSVSGSRPKGRSGETMFAASRVERRPSLTVLRTVLAHGEDEAFSFDEALSTAAVAEVPSPFEGAADFIRDAEDKVCVRAPCDRSSWLGPLAVDFPGAADVPLAGPNFHARLFRADPFGSGTQLSIGSGG